MSFEKESQPPKGYKLILKIVLKIYPLVEDIENFLLKMCCLGSDGDLQNKILIDWTCFAFYGKYKVKGILIKALITLRLQGDNGSFPLTKFPLKAGKRYI